MIDLVKIYQLAFDYDNQQLLNFLLEYCEEGFMYIWGELACEYDDNESNRCNRC